MKSNFSYLDDAERHSVNFATLHLSSHMGIKIPHRISTSGKYKTVGALLALAIAKAQIEGPKWKFCTKRTVATCLSAEAACIPPAVREPLYLKHEDAAQNIKRFNPVHITFFLYLATLPLPSAAEHNSQVQGCIMALAPTDMESSTCSPSYWKEMLFLTLHFFFSFSFFFPLSSPDLSSYNSQVEHNALYS